jgi:hypothetical protein
VDYGEKRQQAESPEAVNSLEAKEPLTEIKEYPYTISHFKNG